PPGRRADLPCSGQGPGAGRWWTAHDARAVGRGPAGPAGHFRRGGGRDLVNGRFDGRTALVTGGGRGIGAATANRFAAEGAAVVVSDLDREPAEAVSGEIRKSGWRALPIACDVTERAAVEQLFESAVREFDTVDILVTCAGI